MLLSLSYETVATWSQVASLLMFIAMFAGVLFYALRPGNGPRFDVVQRCALDLGQSQTDKGAGT